jgi:hypothetical protein
MALVVWNPNIFYTQQLYHHLECQFHVMSAASAVAVRSTGHYYHRAPKNV